MEITTVKDETWNQNSSAKGREEKERVLSVAQPVELSGQKLRRT